MHAPAEQACPSCGGHLKHLAEDVSEQLEYVPASLQVIRPIRPSWPVRAATGIVQVPAPSRPIERGLLPGSGMLAHVLAAKLCGRLPLYLGSVSYELEGVELSTALLAGWVSSACSDLLTLLVDVIGRRIRAAGKLHADDTPLPALAPRLGKTKLARLWTYVRDERPSGSLGPPAIWFAYAPDRKGPLLAAGASI